MRQRCLLLRTSYIDTQQEHVNTLKVGRRRDIFVRSTQRTVMSTKIDNEVVEIFSEKCEIQ